MSRVDRLKWNARYEAGAYAGRDHPAQLLADWAMHATRGRALDVACGAGRNSVFLSAEGFEVDAIDISATGIERARETAAAKGVRVRWIEGDLEEEPEALLPAGPYDLIVMVRYVNPNLYPLLLDRLADKGIFLCEEHLQSDEEDVIGPRNPDYRLSPGELLQSVTAVAAPKHRVLSYREGKVTDPDGRRAALAQLVLRREPDRPTAESLSCKPDA